MNFESHIKEWVLLDKHIVLKSKTLSFVRNIMVVMKEAEKRVTGIQKKITEEWFSTFTMNFCVATMKFIKCKKILNNCIRDYSKTMVFQKNLLPRICNGDYNYTECIKNYETFEREEVKKQELRELGEYFYKLNNS